MPSNLPHQWHRPLVFVASLIVLIATLSVVAAGDGTLAGDLRLARWLQDASFPGAGNLATAGNHLGASAVGAPIALAAALALAWMRQFLTAAVVLLANLCRLLNEPLKSVFDSPRPTGADVRVIEIAQHFGFPSGHAMGSLLLYGSLAIAGRRLLQPAWARRAVVWMAGAVILLVGFGRIYVGAHWPSDVLGGYLWGIAFLLVSVAAVTFAANLIPEHTPVRGDSGLQSPGAND
jgi:membrane-associated phospholipid phosphatase